MLLWADDFTKYSLPADTTLNYVNTSANPTSILSGTGPVSGSGIRLSGSAGGCAVTIAGTATSGGTIHVAFKYKVSSLSGSAQVILRMKTNIQTFDNTEPKLRLNTDGSLTATFHGNTGDIVSSAAGVIAAGTGYYIEYAGKFNASGTIKVWVNGNLVINFAGSTLVGSGPSTFTGVRFARSANNGENMDFGDVIVWDEAGTDFVYTQLSSSYLPDLESLTPDADDSVTWTHNTGASNFGAVDDAGTNNGDTDYNSSTNVGDIDLFTVSDPATTPSVVFGIFVRAIAKIDVAGIVNLRLRLSSSGTVGESGDFALTTTYVQYSFGYGKDPNTSAQFVTTQPASVKIGYKYQS